VPFATIQLLAQTVRSDSRWDFHPQLPYWLLAVFAAIAVALVLVLYLAQSRVASRGAVIALSVIRTLLILLVFGMLLGPAWVFTSVTEMPGTLFTLVDRSGSMSRADPHATPIERLRWADAAGLLPAGARPGAVDRQAARLRLVDADLRRYQDLTRAVPDEGTAPARMKELTEGLRRCHAALTAAADALDKDPTPQTNPELRNELRRIAGEALAAAEKVKGYTRPDQAAADLEKFGAYRKSLQTGAADLDAAANAADEALLAKNDPGVVAAVAKAGTLTRAEIAQAVLTDKSRRNAAGFDTVFPRQPVRVITFGDVAAGSSPSSMDQNVKAVRESLTAADTPATDEVAALQQAQRELKPTEPSAVVVIGDGRHNRRETDPRDDATQIAARGARVYTIGTGSATELVPDAAVETLDAPEWVFKGDSIKFTAVVRLDNLPTDKVKVGLYRVRDASGSKQETLVEQIDLTRAAAARTPGVAPRAGDNRRNSYRQTLSFSERAEALEKPGVYDYQVRVEPIDGETVKENNAQAARVAVRDDKFTVLMIDDQARWEYRYAQNYFARDNRVRVQSKLVRPARIGDDDDPTKNASITEARKPSTEEEDPRTDFQLLPENQGEWNQWKLIVIGDIGPDALPRAQQEMIVKAVLDGGATLIFLAGPLQLPGKWGIDKEANPLVALLPVEPSDDVTEADRARRRRAGYFPVPAPDASNHLLNQLAVGDAENAEAWAKIARDKNSAWYWHSEYVQARPGASVIWSIGDSDVGRPATRPAASPATRPIGVDSPTALQTARKRALLVTRSAGPGKVMYLDGEQSWRMRQVKGVNYHERFWGQVLRWAVDGELPAGGKFVRFGTDKPRYVGGESAVVTARVVDKTGKSVQGAKIRAVARLINPDPSKPNVPVEVQLREDPTQPGTYSGTLPNLPDGASEITLAGPEVEPLLAEDPKAVTKSLTVDMVRSANVEQQNVNPDHAALAAQAEAGGGAMVPIQYADLLAEHVPVLQFSDPSAKQIALFANPDKEPYARMTHWVFLGLFAALITAEWIIRKRAGLV
jgi:hypothetical protein